MGRILWAFLCVRCVLRCVCVLPVVFACVLCVSLPVVPAQPNKKQFQSLLSTFFAKRFLAV